jgi:uncharacterized membrane protein
VTPLAISLCILAQIGLVGGQVMLKHAMTISETAASPAGGGRSRALAFGTAGIALFTLWFFLWLGLLRDWELSRLFPFEGLSAPLLVGAAWLFLGERIRPRGWLGIALIGVGVALVSAS